MLAFVIEPWLSIFINITIHDNCCAHVKTYVCWRFVKITKTNFRKFQIINNSLHLLSFMRLMYSFQRRFNNLRLKTNTERNTIIQGRKFDPRKRIVLLLHSCVKDAQFFFIFWLLKFCMFKRKHVIKKWHVFEKWNPQLTTFTKETCKLYKL